MRKSFLSPTANALTNADRSWGAAANDIKVALDEIKPCQGAGCNGSTRPGSTATTSSAITRTAAVASYAVHATTVGQTGPIFNTAATTSTTTSPNAGGITDQASLQTATLGGAGMFPLSVSSNGRYLKTASGDPFLMVGDSPWTVIGNSDESHADTYFADRAANGFNVVLISLLCDAYISCSRSDGKAYDGTAPFTSGTSIATYDLTT